MDFRSSSFKAAAKPKDSTIIRKKFRSQELSDGPIPSCLKSTSFRDEIQKYYPDNEEQECEKVSVIYFEFKNLLYDDHLNDGNKKLGDQAGISRTDCQQAWDQDKVHAEIDQLIR